MCTRLRCQELLMVSSVSALVLLVFQVSYGQHRLELPRYYRTNEDGMNPKQPHLSERNNTKISTTQSGRISDYNECQRERKMTLKRACLADVNSYIIPKSQHDVADFFHIDKNHSIIYCRIQKVGSSFIWSILNQLDSTNKHPGINSLDQMGKLKLADLYSLIKNSFKFMFVREPYERLFSGYIDKLYSANFEFWGYGIDIRNRMNKFYHENKVTTCGHDLTFHDIVRYVVFAEKHMDITRDRHFTPMFDHCRPCQIDYDFIGKLETMDTDVNILVDSWNAKYGTNIKSRKLTNNVSKDRISDQLKRLFKRKQDIVQCFPFYYALKREWNTLKIVGILPLDVPMPFTELDADDVTYEEMVKIVTTLQKEADQESLKRQRRDAMVEAYSSVPMEDLLRLKEVLLPDCQLFGYDPSPEFIYNRKEKRKSKFFMD